MAKQWYCQWTLKGLQISLGNWPGFRLGPLQPAATVDGKAVKLKESRRQKISQRETQIVFTADGGRVTMEFILRREAGQRCRLRGAIRNNGKRSWRLNDAGLMGQEQTGILALGPQAPRVRILEQSPYMSQVRSAGQIMSGSDGRKSLDGQPRRVFTTDVLMLYHPDEEAGLMIAMETFDRFKGTLTLGMRRQGGKIESGKENVDKGSAGICRLYEASDLRGLKPLPRFTAFSFLQRCGDIIVEPGEEVRLEEIVIETRKDPHDLLAGWAERIAKRYHTAAITPKPFANWCSWYAERLGVSQERMLANARAAKQRHLDELGLRFIQADLGWERHNVPTFFEENERFDKGLKWLSHELRKLGFELGAWKGFACVAESHPIFRDHPDWLVKDEAGRALECWTWFWQPHEKIYALDVTQPEALRWIYENVASLAKRGVRYLKWDFGGMLLAKGRRFNEKIAASESYEAMRLAGKTVQQAMDSTGEKGLVLDCTTGEMANVGQFGLFYTNVDTGNNGLGFKHLRSTYSTAACHLYKQYRLGLLQPSCLTTHGPGTLEEAQLRAAATFMMAGHVDISDELTDLPEDRWQVITSVLPPVTTPACPVDLYYPVGVGVCSYEAMCRGIKEKQLLSDEPQGATVWRMNLQNDWDEWLLVALMNYFHSTDAGGSPVPLQFDIPTKYLGLAKGKEYWGYEFWSGMFTGRWPLRRDKKPTYRHPGDYARLLMESGSETLRAVFSGPAVKLLALRKMRKHPWPVGTTFHQSCGMELKEVTWDKKKGRLSGVLERPAGQKGSLVIAGCGPENAWRTAVEGKQVPAVWGANGGLIVPVVTAAKQTRWEITRLR